MSTFAQWKYKFRSLLSRKRLLLCVISTFITLLAIVLSIVMMQVYMARDISYNVLPFQVSNATTKVYMTMIHNPMEWY